MKRKKDESWDDYKERRRQLKKFEKQRLKGFLFWNSSIKGTYRVAEHGTYKNLTDKAD